MYFLGSAGGETAKKLVDRTDELVDAIFFLEAQLKAIGVISENNKQKNRVGGQQVGVGKGAKDTVLDAVDGHAGVGNKLVGGEEQGGGRSNNKAEVKNPGEFFAFLAAQDIAHAK